VPLLYPSMRPLFAIAPLAMLLAVAAPHPSRWDANALSRQDSEASPRMSPASTPQPSHTAPSGEHAPAVLRTSTHSLPSVSAEVTYPQGLHR